jgi:hypothetical protein
MANGDFIAYPSRRLDRRRAGMIRSSRLPGFT